VVADLVDNAAAQANDNGRFLGERGRVDAPQRYA
jgi:hypothetical protein